MKHVITLLTIMALLLSAMAYGDASQDAWTDISYGIDEPDLMVIAVNPGRPDLMYAGSIRSVFKSADSGRTWVKCYSVRGTGTAVNALAFDPKRADCVYAGTQNGLFKTIDGGKTWNAVTVGVGAAEKYISHIAIDDGGQTIYLSTARGMFKTTNGGETWNRLLAIGSMPINFAAISPFDPNIIYAAATTGLFRSKNGGENWERTFVAAAQNQDDEDNEESAASPDADQASTPSNKMPLCISIDERRPENIYLGTGTGVFHTADGGSSWEKLTTAGLINSNVRSLVISNDDSLFAATENGVFRLSASEQKWNEICEGLMSKNTRFLCYDAKNDAVFAATKRGIYKRTAGEGGKVPPSPGRPEKDDPAIQKILSQFNHEPSIQEIQNIAVRYAEVNNEKIKQWRKEARNRALLPKLSVGVDHDIRNTSEIYTSSTQSYWTTGPDNETTSWDVTVSWDLGELIWNDDQTNIDVRSRLMVQLRDDILNEVTRLYFERRKVQVELLTNPPKVTAERITKELKLQELTAGIDALTGGYLTRRSITQN